MSQFTLEIVTPDRKFFEDEVEMVIVRGIEGDIGILKNHTPMVTPLSIGKIRIKKDGEIKEAAIAGGYIEITKNKTTVITDAAEWPEEIDVRRAEEAKKRAEQRLKSGKGEIDVVRAQIALKKALNRLELAKKK
ncbi:ATP synthase F1 subcomplex epsilon subunit [Caloranaerobacter azorensis DSM 13643]|uniref:ATP synthase epsilon chain n=1 Tax=Caloranaerobacter azorensis DSM 13643 TaxID=1121264 RepID=A0A1M5W426_9FIRM|nr:F0F1 ATP synthase subunit epsilon [Caloranaerobacter azorensis]SHH82272.1 ATP synthase F1 subcomplex epsilon subunit [Caloranaerobacter azorensis DSM 13643]